MKQFFKNKVALITGAGGGLGRSHALCLAKQGCAVVVNDLGTTVNGEAGQTQAAQETVELIKKLGGRALANSDSVATFQGAQSMVEAALTHFGRLDIVINNAGILRDASFKKQSEDDWQKIIDVHLTGARHVTKAAWDCMLQQKYGRIVFTTSASGLYGNYGQSNYAAAKMGLIGLMQALKEEGAKNNIFLNAIAPVAKSRMTESLLPPDLLALLNPEHVSALVAFLCSADCTETGSIFSVGAGRVSRVVVAETSSIKLPDDLSQIGPALTLLTEVSCQPHNLMEATSFLLRTS